MSPRGKNCDAILVPPSWMPTACTPSWGQRGNGERLFHGEAWQGVMARVGQATSRVLVWFCVVKHESIGCFNTTWRQFKFSIIFCASCSGGVASIGTGESLVLDTLAEAAAAVTVDAVSV